MKRLMQHNGRELEEIGVLNPNANLTLFEAWVANSPFVIQNVHEADLDAETEGTAE